MDLEEIILNEHKLGSGSYVYVVLTEPEESEARLQSYHVFKWPSKGCYFICLKFIWSEIYMV